MAQTIQPTTSTRKRGFETKASLLQRILQHKYLIQYLCPTCLLSLLGWMSEIAIYWHHTGPKMCIYIQELACKTTRYKPKGVQNAFTFHAR